MNDLAADVQLGAAARAARDEWSTPLDIIERAKLVLGGGIDLDPASSAWHNARIGAAAYFDTQRDGLKHSWRVRAHGATRVWLNPPYSQPLCKRFVERFVERGVKGRIEGLLLINNATETKHFQLALRTGWPVLFFAGRLSFVHPDGRPGNQNRNAQALVYCGPNPTRFAAHFGDLGTITQTYRGSFDG